MASSGTRGSFRSTKPCVPENGVCNSSTAILRVGPYDPPNANRNRLPVIPCPNLYRLPALVGEIHGDGNTLDRCHRRRRKKPAGAAHTQQAGLYFFLFVVEVPRDADRRVSKRCRINTSRLDATGRHDQHSHRKQPALHEPPVAQRIRVCSRATKSPSRQ